MSFRSELTVLEMRELVAKVRESINALPYHQKCAFRFVDVQRLCNLVEQKANDQESKEYVRSIP